MMMVPSNPPAAGLNAGGNNEIEDLRRHTEEQSRALREQISQQQESIQRMIGGQQLGEPVPAVEG